MSDKPLDTTKTLEVDLSEDGLLWLINRTTFHPRGFALGRSSDGKMYLLGDGSEPVQFAADMEDEYFAAVEAVLQRARENNGG